MMPTDRGMTTSQAPTLAQQRALNALQQMFVADALAMPVHWFYNPQDIERAFPGGIKGFAAAPDFHPSSIMALHSTIRGGRGTQNQTSDAPEVVGGVILKGRRKYWGIANQHYHRGMQAGENTLNAHCARVLMRCLGKNAGRYDKEQFLDAYITFMTADPPEHPDTYAESYHRGFFANLACGQPRDRCGAVTHDTSSIGGLVTIAPLVLAERLAGVPLAEVRQHCRAHLELTHPDRGLVQVCDAYVVLLDGLLCRPEGAPVEPQILAAAQSSAGFDPAAWVDKDIDDRQVVGAHFSSACYISESWPSVLYLAYKYRHQPRQGLLANTNLGGDNVHRGSVLGVLFGLMNFADVVDDFYQLADQAELFAEISALLGCPDSDPALAKVRRIP
ncbi:MAG: ADP-ribosylglycohydrolase family protein [Desulfuromonadales bacterium]